MREGVLTSEDYINRNPFLWIYFSLLHVQEQPLFLPASVARVTVHSPQVPGPELQRTGRRGSTRNPGNGAITLDRCRDRVLTGGAEPRWGQGKKQTFESPAILFFKGQISLGDK